MTNTANCSIIIFKKPKIRVFLRVNEVFSIVFCEVSIMGFLIVVLCILFLWPILYIDHIVALKFEKVAFDKGYDESIHSYHMCFWLGIIGYLYVIALPIKTEKHPKSDTEPKECDKSKNGKYSCLFIAPTGEKASGKCEACYDTSSLPILEYYLVKKEKVLAMKKMLLCEKCIQLFKSNSSS